METRINISEDIYKKALDFALDVIKITRSKESHIDVVHAALLDTGFFLNDYKNAVRRVLNNKKMECHTVSLEYVKFGTPFTTNSDFHCKICDGVFPASEQVRYSLKSGATKTLNRCWECHRKKRKEYESYVINTEDAKIKKSERNEVYYLKNKDERMRKKRERYNQDAEFREKEKLRSKKYRETHPEWYAAFKERLRESRKSSLRRTG